MKGSERDVVFNSLIKISELLLKECESLAEIIDYTEDAPNVVKRVIAHEEDADDTLRELNFFFGENMLLEDSEARSVYLIIEAVELCTDQLEELARDFIRYDITSVRDNCVTSILDFERAAKKTCDLVFKLRDKDKINSPYKDIIELDQFKMEAKKLFDVNMNKLFSTEKDPIEIMKWERIYRSIYAVFEAYEQVSITCAKYNLAWQ